MPEFFLGAGWIEEGSSCDVRPAGWVYDMNYMCRQVLVTSEESLRDEYFIFKNYLWSIRYDQSIHLKVLKRL